jgi:DNA mismatch repair protein MutL
MGKIQTLSKNLINLIAAGEVVERPASVVKELVENSIDAKASEITINISDYGKEIIEVIDNGIGMDRDDAGKAFLQHATSKISSEDDLQNILTMGFRGEALASISSVAESIEVETKTVQDEPVALQIEQTNFLDKPSGKSSNGTRITINKLFQNVPARKKFLKADNTELRYIINTFNEIALSNLEIRFELQHNNKLLYRLPQAKNIKDRIFDIYSGSITNGLFDEKKLETESYQIKALICKPEAARKASPIQYISMNGRSITNKAILAAVNQAYQGFIHKDLKPYFFLFIHIDPKLVDVNVHPRKLEVRFENQDQIFKDVFRLVRATLESVTKSNVVSSLTESVNSLPTRNLSSYTPSSSKPKTSSVQQFRSSGNVNDAISFSKFLIETSKEAPIEFEHETLSNEPIIPLQYFNTFITYEKGGELIFVDQHAAAEKILFEKLLFNINGVSTKPLLVPEIVELKSADKAEVMKLKPEFEKIGIILEDFGGSSIQVLEIPEQIKSLDLYNYIYEILNNEEDFSKLELEYKGRSLPTELYNILALTACHGSVRAGQKLNTTEMLEIINNLSKLENPQSCPHGRPTIWKLPKSSIEKNFKRII